MAGTIEALVDNLLSLYAAGCAALLSAAGFALFLKRLRLSGRAEGEITGYQRRMQSRARSTDLFMPEVCFGSIEHGQRRFVSRMSADPEDLPVGTRVPVAYSRSDASNVEVATLGRLWAAPVALLFFAAAMAAVALAA